VDADVHCPVPSLDELFPYLDDHWQDYLRWTNFRMLEPTAEATYPSWSTMLATPQSESAFERMRDEVLARSTYAILQCYSGVEAVVHPYLAAALATAVNSWLADAWLDRDDRLRAAAAITPQHTAAAVEEIHRVAADARFVQILLPARSSEPYGNQRYWPVWEAAAEHGLVLGLAYGGTTGAPPTPLNWMSSFYEHYVLATQTFRTHLTSLVASGVFERWPELRIVCVESGWAWVPGFLWRMDFEWKANVQEVPWVKEAPSVYVKRHVRFTSQPADLPSDPQHLANLLDRFPLETLMYSSDHPHRYDGGIDQFMERLTSDQQERVRWTNARDLYGLDADV
jgi:predicted TIM-barrel fold metal-dependent hydrolase